MPIEIVLKLFVFIFITKAETFKPNIVVIVADDLGWNDVSFHGSNQILTPNIDAMAYNGIVLNRFYVQSICTPSRAALLTGQYPSRYGFQAMPILAGEDRYLPTHLKTLPSHLKNLGYTTRLIGKWHLGFSYLNNTPTYRGFDSHFGYWVGAIHYFSHINSESYVGYDMRDNLVTSWNTQYEYATRLFTRKSVETILQHNYETPLFLMIAHLAVHAGTKNRDFDLPDADEYNEIFRYIGDRRRRLFAGVVTELDKSVGAVFKALSDRGVLNNTIILFLSDNGAQNTKVGYDNSGSNWPLRGMKGKLFEGGVRTPSIIYYEMLKNKNTINNQLMHITDVMPTLYSAAGGDLDDLGMIDGISQWDAINDEISARTNVLVDIDEVYSRFAFVGHSGRYKLINDSISSPILMARDGYFGKDTSVEMNPAYDVNRVLLSTTNQVMGNGLTAGEMISTRNKLIINCTHIDVESNRCDNSCLFDVINDPCETKNLIKKYPNVVAELNEELLPYFQVLRPQATHVIDSKCDPINFNGTYSTWMEYQ
ncbi:hypothetical protein RI129_012955 [Pyrocoelia pectoralis]|uniref:Sulfatase N-terminal domain-containing protein n=1 Tax=Pyrocoelia pectoralis TaxID=417401 RepID=A0AAN7Z713_9COLE